MAVPSTRSTPPMSALAIGACAVGVCATLALATAPDATSPPAPASMGDGQIYTLGAMGELPSSFKVVPGTFAPERRRGFCPLEPRLANFVEDNTYVIVPGFVRGEEAAATFIAPQSHYPIEIVEVGIGWLSVFGGGTKPSLEDSILIYHGRPNAPDFYEQFVAEAPSMEDGGINVFDLTTGVVPGGNRVIDGGPFTISLRIFNRPNQFTGPAPIHDGEGCQFLKSYVRTATQGWRDNCTLGVSGQWVIFAKYRRVVCGEDPPCPADITGNGLVNSGDLAELLASWGPGPSAADLNGDGFVNSQDLAVLLGGWGPCP